jgi:hypothetical protein
LSHKQKRKLIRKIQMDKQQADDWNNKTSGNLIISEEYQFFVRHADLFLKNNELVKKQLIETLQLPLSGLELSVDTHKNSKKTWYSRRITADSLNVAIKQNLRFNMPEMKFEVDFKEGVFYDSPKVSGFDFAIFDDAFNLVNFRNYCFGRRPIYQGRTTWEDEMGKENREEWKDLAELYKLESYPLGIDLPYSKCKPTIIGEVQFGNWGLVYYDILKTIQISQLYEIDLLIYLVAAGNLSKYISDGTVNFEKTKKALDEFKNIINFNVWLIGVDLE